MKERFEIAFGSITGKDHRWSGRNNQDAYYYLVNEEVIVAIVCDGCSESRHSEVGAKLGARLIGEGVRQNFNRYQEALRFTGTEEVWSRFLERVRRDVLAELRILALAMGEGLSETVSDYFLFTVVGAVVTREESVIFSLGDGVYIVNGEITRLGPFPANEPPYFAYNGLVDSSVGNEHPELLNLSVQKIIPTPEVKNLLIGTDGVAGLIDVSEQNLPGKEEKVGPISQFWTDDRFFQNWDMVRRRLSLINRELARPIWQERRIVKEGGLLPDDTTLVVIRKKANARKEG